METDEDGNLTFLSRLAQRMEQTKVDIPTVTLEYKDLVVDADALVGAAANPSVINSALSAVKVSNSLCLISLGVFSSLMFVDCTLSLEKAMQGVADEPCMSVGIRLDVVR